MVSGLIFIVAGRLPLRNLKNISTQTPCLPHLPLKIDYGNSIFLVPEFHEKPELFERVWRQIFLQHMKGKGKSSLTCRSFSLMVDNIKKDQEKKI